LKEQKLELVLQKNPERIIMEAVMGMMPKNSLSEDVVKKNLILISTFRSIGWSFYFATRCSK
jgi:ribosomal protein L13